jgi:tripeptidyl-peptidase-1
MLTMARPTWTCKTLSPSPTLSRSQNTSLLVAREYSQKVDDDANRADIGSCSPYIPDPVEPAGTTNENEPYLPYYEFLLSQPNHKLPQVITNSYGDDEQTVPEKYAVRVCNLIGILGMRGVSVLESSGDTGVGAACLNQDGKTPQFNPVFPATCPYVTAVGGTVDLAPEIAWSGSSGGFSNYFKAPWYQKAAVQHYLNTYVSAETKEYYGQYVNFTGRGFPDVAALSVHPE